jgi:small-conductance mechanosensitive channel
MRNINPSGQIPPSASAYSPSVPISLYREVTAELQATKTTMEALTQQNQQLAKQNQQLRQEIERAAQSAIHLRQIVTNLPPVGSAEISTPRMEPIEPPIPTMPSRPPVTPKPSRAEVAETIVYEQESQPRRKIQSDKKSAELGGWWLGLVILLIVITAFGTGFLIVRPLLPSSNK